MFHHMLEDANRTLEEPLCCITVCQIGAKDKMHDLSVVTGGSTSDTGIESSSTPVPQDHLRSSHNISLNYDRTLCSVGRQQSCCHVTAAVA